MEQKPEVTSKQYWLNAKDFLRGLLMAIGSAVLTVIYTSFEAGNFEIDWKSTLKVGIAAGVMYLLKNFFQPAQVKQTISNTEHDQLKAAPGETTNAAK